jgi:CheY-like chemotaxis protein
VAVSGFNDDKPVKHGKPPLLSALDTFFGRIKYLEDIMANHGKIIIIDDNPDYVFTMETYLKFKGFDVLSTGDAKKGLALTREGRPDLILLDIMMETTFSGFEVCQQIREDPDLGYIPIIAISGMGEDLRYFFEKGAREEHFNPDDFFEKPVDKDRLLSRIETLLEEAQARNSG